MPLTSLKLECNKCQNLPTFRWSEGTIHILKPSQVKSCRISCPAGSLRSKSPYWCSNTKAQHRRQELFTRKRSEPDLLWPCTSQTDVMRGAISGQVMTSTIAISPALSEDHGANLCTVLLCLSQVNINTTGSCLLAVGAQYEWWHINDPPFLIFSSADKSQGN